MSHKKRISFEVSSMSLSRPTGVGRYIEKLVGSMLDLTAEEFDYSLLYKLSRFSKRKDWWRPDRIKVRLFQEQFKLFFGKQDLIHGLDCYVPNWKKTIKLASIHDLAILKLKNQNISSQRFYDSRVRLYKQTAALADGIITISQTTAKDISEWLGVSEEKIFVTPLGVEEVYKPVSADRIEDVKKKYGINRSYFLFVGSISERKNTERLVKAYGLSKASDDIQLVLAGEKSFQWEKTAKEIESSNLNKKVIVPGYVDDEDLPALYSGAAGFLFPTFYEGFGLPILEAMSCGTPVLTGDKGAASETSGGHAVIVDVYDVEAIAEGIDKLVKTTQFQKDEAMKYASEFTWKKCAQKTLEVYNHFL